VGEFLDQPPALAQVAPGISPHATYTVHPQVLDSLVHLARERHVPLAMHLAESREELELLHSGRGPFRSLLADLNAWNPAPDARYRSIVQYLEALSHAPRALVIHGNYLSDAEHEFLADNSATMSVVYCPRTHAYFGHDAYPLETMLNLGVHVAIGTDSRASNPDLDLWAELKFVQARHRQIEPSTLLSLATRHGAKALGVEADVGTLEPGKFANLAVVALTAGAGDPHERLWADDSRVVDTVLRGQRLTAGSW
jgi:cytosine/adenosine deaminase-related metal-dependent hydrolase